MRPTGWNPGLLGSPHLTPERRRSDNARNSSLYPAYIQYYLRNSINASVSDDPPEVPISADSILSTPHRFEARAVSISRHAGILGDINRLKDVAQKIGIKIPDNMEPRKIIANILAANDLTSMKIPVTTILLDLLVTFRLDVALSENIAFLALSKNSCLNVCSFALGDSTTLVIPYIINSALVPLEGVSELLVSSPASQFDDTSSGYNDAKRPLQNDIPKAPSPLERTLLSAVTQLRETHSSQCILLSGDSAAGFFNIQSMAATIFISAAEPVMGNFTMKNSLLPSINAALRVLSLLNTLERPSSKKGAIFKEPACRFFPINTRFIFSKTTGTLEGCSFHEGPIANTLFKAGNFDGNERDMALNVYTDPTYKSQLGGISYEVEWVPSLLSSIFEDFYMHKDTCCGLIAEGSVNNAKLRAIFGKERDSPDKHEVAKEMNTMLNNSIYWAGDSGQFLVDLRTLGIKEADIKKIIRTTFTIINLFLTTFDSGGHSKPGSSTPTVSQDEQFALEKVALLLGMPLSDVLKIFAYSDGTTVDDIGNGPLDSTEDLNDYHSEHTRIARDRIVAVPLNDGKTVVHLNADHAMQMRNLLVHSLYEALAIFTIREINSGILNFEKRRHLGVKANGSKRPESRGAPDVDYLTIDIVELLQPANNNVVDAKLSQFLLRYVQDKAVAKLIEHDDSDYDKLPDAPFSMEPHEAHQNETARARKLACIAEKTSILKTVSEYSSRIASKNINRHASVRSKLRESKLHISNTGKLEPDYEAMACANISLTPTFVDLLLKKKMRFADEIESIFFLDLMRLLISLLLPSRKYFSGKNVSYSNRPVNLPKSLRIKEDVMPLIERHLSYCHELENLISSRKTWLILSVNSQEPFTVAAVQDLFETHCLAVLTSTAQSLYANRLSKSEFRIKYLDTFEGNHFRNVGVKAILRNGSSLNTRIAYYLDFISKDFKAEDRLKVQYCITKKYVYLSEVFKAFVAQKVSNYAASTQKDYFQLLYHGPEVLKQYLLQAMGGSNKVQGKSVLELTNEYYNEQLDNEFDDADRIIKLKLRDFDLKRQDTDNDKSTDSIAMGNLRNGRSYANEATENSGVFLGEGSEELVIRQTVLKLLLTVLWRFFLFLARVLIPNIVLEKCFKRRVPLTQQLWRERLVMIIIMLIGNCFFIFWIIGLRRIGCPVTSDSQVSSLLQKRRVGSDVERVFMYGYHYGTGSIKAIPQHSNWPTNINGKDVSSLFRKDNAWNSYCSFTKPSGFSLYPALDSQTTSLTEPSMLTSPYEIANWNYNHSMPVDYIASQKRRSGKIVWSKSAIREKLHYLQVQFNWTGSIFIAYGKVYDISSMQHQMNANATLIFPSTINSYFLEGDWDRSGGDLTAFFQSLVDKNAVSSTLHCLDELFAIGFVPSKRSAVCIIPNVVLCVYVAILMIPLFTRLVVSLIRHLKEVSPTRKVQMQQRQWENDKTYFGTAEDRQQPDNIPFDSMGGTLYRKSSTTELQTYRKSLDVPTSLSIARDIAFSPVKGRICNVLMLVQFYADTQEQVFNALDGIYNQIFAPNENCMLVISCDGGTSLNSMSTADSVRKYFDIEANDSNEFIYESRTHPIYKLNRIVIQPVPNASKNGRKIPMVLLIKKGWLEDTDLGNRGVRDTHSIILAILFKEHEILRGAMDPGELTDMDKFLLAALSNGPANVSSYEFLLLNDSRFVLQPFAVSELAKFLCQNDDFLGVTGRINVSHVSLIHLWDLYSTYYLDKLFEALNYRVTNLETGFTMIRIFERSSTSSSGDSNDVLSISSPKQDTPLTDSSQIYAGYYKSDLMTAGIHTIKKIAIHPGVLNDYLRLKQDTLHWKILLNSKYSGYLTSVLLRRFSKKMTGVVVTAEARYNEPTTLPAVYERQVHYFNSSIHNFILNLSTPAGRKCSCIYRFQVNSRLVLRTWSPAIIVCTYYLLIDSVLGDDNFGVTYPFLVLIAAFVCLYALILALQRQWRIMGAFALHTVLLCPVFMIVFPVCSWFGMGSTLDAHDSLLLHGRVV